MPVVNTETGEVGDITGVHPAADVWPMLDEPDLRRLADDIKTHGLRHPIIVDGHGRILDGRNRHAACQIAAVEPDVEVYHGDAATLVLSENNERRHMSLPERAAATAMTLGPTRRKSGRWERGSVPDSGDSANSGTWQARMKEAGALLDWRPDLLPEVAAGRLDLKSAHEQAQSARRETERLAELPDDLRALVESGSLPMSDALRRATLPADYADRVAESHLSLDEAEELATRDEREHTEAVDRTKRYIEAFLTGLHAAANLTNDPLRDDVLDALSERQRDDFLRIEKETSWPTTI